MLTRRRTHHNAQIDRMRNCAYITPTGRVRHEPSSDNGANRLDVKNKWNQIALSSFDLQARQSLN